ncbi:MAG: hypothetical protein ACE37F_01250 [Nannocystaceae bacterium]|nr:tetratricopeptide repeat protein [bacterium]
MAATVLEIVLGLGLAGGLAVDEPAERADEPTATPADAQPDPRAVAAFEAGQKAFANADFFTALHNFQRAQQLAPTPELHYNIGLCHERVDNWDRAIESFEHYLEETPDAFDRADVEARIRAAKRRRAKEARVTPPALTPGKSDPPPSPPPTRVQPSLDAEPEVAAHRALVVSGASLLAVGIAGGIAGPVAMTMGIRDNDIVLRRFNAGNPEGIPIEDARAIEQESRTLNTARWVTVGVGGAVAATGAVLLGVGLKRRADARRYAEVIPNMGPHSAGVTVAGRF